MKAVWTIARREIRGFFDYPTAYILIIAFVALGLFLAFRTVLPQRIGTLRPFFDLLPWLFSMFVPAMTMRSLAEERRSHTLEWLMAQPVSEVQVVAGKFIGDWLFVLIGLAMTLPAAIGILAVASADPGIMVAQYVGAALLSAEAVAIGLWASAVTRNQITAFILAASVTLVLVLIGTQVVTLALPAGSGGFVGALAMLTHFADVARGVIDLRDVLYFVTSTGLFLVLAALALSRERLSHERGAYRRVRTGAVAIGVGVVVANLLGSYLRARLDLTRDRLYTLSPQTRAIVHALPDVAQIKLYVSSQLPPSEQIIERDVRDLVEDLGRASNGNLRVLIENPENDPSAQKEAASYGIQPVDFNVLQSNQFQVTHGWFGLAVLYGGQQRSIPQIDQTDDLEYRLASDIASMTATTKPKLGFLWGFGAHSPDEVPTLARTITDRYNVTPIKLEGDPDLSRLSPDSLKAVVIDGPKTPINPLVIVRLDQYLDAGGSILLLLQNVHIDPRNEQPVRLNAGLAPFLFAHGVAMDPGIVTDPKSAWRVPVNPPNGGPSVMMPYPAWPILRKAGDHETTRGLSNLTAFWPAPLRILDHTHVIPLWETTDHGGVRSPLLPESVPAVVMTTPDSGSHQIVAVAVEPSLHTGPSAGVFGAASTGRMVVVGDAEGLDEDFVSHGQALLFAGNALDWLTQRENLIGIRSKHRAPPELLFDSNLGINAFYLGNLLGIPILIAAFGIGWIARRERRARSRWGTDGLATGGRSGDPTPPVPANPAR